MKKLFSLLLALVFISLAFVTTFNNVFAEEAGAVGKLESTDCFSPGLYKFQSVQVSVGPELQNYKAGDTINFFGDIINENNYPVVDGNVFVRIGKVNPDYITDGHNTVDEILAVSNISIDASSSLPVSFTWMIPKDLGAGEYRADYFFSVGGKFNLGGLPFTNEIIVGFANFQVTNTKNTEFVLDRTATKVNGEKYNHIGAWPELKSGEKVEITQPVKNLTNKEIKVTVNYDLFFWDSLNAEDKLDSKTEAVTIPANSSKNLTYGIPKSDQSVYYLRVKATSGDASSMVNIRIGVDVPKARINYPAITAFPLVKGQTADLFSCFHTVYGLADNHKLVLTLMDKDGSNVAKGEYTGTFDTMMTAASMKFTADKDYRLLNLKAELFDNKGKVVDSYQTTYDCATLKSPKCEVDVNKNVTLYSLIAILIALIGLLVLPKVMGDSSFKKLVVGIFAVLLAVALIVLIWVSVIGMGKVEADRTEIQSPTKTRTEQKPFYIWMDWSSLDSSVTRSSGDIIVSTGTISVTNSITMTGGYNPLYVREKLSFSRDSVCSFSSTGGRFDTPYCGELESYYGINVRTVGTTTVRTNVIFTINEPATPTFTLTSSNPVVLGCDGSSGTTCTALRPGNARVTATVASTQATTSVSYFSAVYNNWVCNYVGKVLGMDKNCGRAGSIDIGDPVINFSAFSPTWDVTVATPVPPTLSTTTATCGGNVALHWNEFAGVSDYQIFKNGTTFLATTTNTFYETTALTGDSFMVRVSLPSFTVGDDIHPTVKPAGVRRTGGISYTKYTLSWTAIPDAIGYEIYLNGAYKSTETGTTYSIYLSFGKAIFIVKPLLPSTISLDSNSISPTPSAPCPGLTASCTATSDNGFVATSTVTWSVTASGTTPYTYSWIGSGADGDNWTAGNQTSVAKSYSVPGPYYANVAVTDSDNPANSITVGCPGNIIDGLSPGIIVNPAVIPVCTDFTYNWSDCTNNTQIGTVVSSFPAGCVGGTPVLERACTLSVSSPCTLERTDGTGDIIMNSTYTDWTASSTIPCNDCQKRWIEVGNLGGTIIPSSYTFSNYRYVLNDYPFGSSGDKKMVVEISDPTNGGYTTCMASTTVRVYSSLEEAAREH